jgi:hypothetical protein
LTSSLTKESIGADSPLKNCTVDSPKLIRCRFLEFAPSSAPILITPIHSTTIRLPRLGVLPIIPPPGAERLSGKVSWHRIGRGDSTHVPCDDGEKENTPAKILILILILSWISMSAPERFYWCTLFNNTHTHTHLKIRVPVAVSETDRKEGFIKAVAWARFKPDVKQNIRKESLSRIFDEWSEYGDRVSGKTGKSLPTPLCYCTLPPNITILITITGPWASETYVSKSWLSSDADVHAFMHPISAVSVHQPRSFLALSGRHLSRTEGTVPFRKKSFSGTPGLGRGRRETRASDTNFFFGVGAQAACSWLVLRARSPVLLYAESTPAGRTVVEVERSSAFGRTMTLTGVPGRPVLHHSGGPSGAAAETLFAF